MSKYLMAKLMRRINAHEPALAAYKRDAAGFVAQWEASEGHRLTDAERAAFAARDYGALYALGAHPFLLWSWTEAVWTPERPREDVVRDYKAQTGAVGYPDFST
jgi:hypothetical protein